MEGKVRDSNITSSEKSDFNFWKMLSVEVGKKCLPVYQTLVDQYFFQDNSKYQSYDKAGSFVFLFKAPILYVYMCVCVYSISKWSDRLGFWI